MHRAIEAGIVDFLYENNLVRLGNDIVAEVNFPNKTEIGLRKQFNKLTYWKGTLSKVKTEKKAEFFNMRCEIGKMLIYIVHTFL